MTKTILKKLIDEFQGDDLAGYIATELKSIEFVKTTVAKIKVAKYRAKDNYNEEIRKLEADLANAQKNCRHLSSTYHGDPAGRSSGSYTQCDFCDKQW